MYRTRTIITRSLFETALKDKLRILEFPFLVHKLSLALSTLQYDIMLFFNRMVKCVNAYKMLKRFIRIS